MVCGRSPLECYTHFMRSFRDAFAEDIGVAIEDVVVGCGPCGELRWVIWIFLLARGGVYLECEEGGGGWDAASAASSGGQPRLFWEPGGGGVFKM